MWGWQWRLRFCCRRRSTVQEVTIVELPQLKRLLEQGRLHPDVQVYCPVCEVLCHDTQQYFEHVKGQKHRKESHALMLNN
jgi:hypothetical protein